MADDTARDPDTAPTERERARLMAHLMELCPELSEEDIVALAREPERARAEMARRTGRKTDELDRELAEISDLFRRI